MSTKISHCLWFDGKAEEAARFYVSLFTDGKVGRIARYGNEGREVHGHDAGDVLTVEFEIDGKRYLALNGGPHFKFNEAFSIVVTCDTQTEIDRLWERLVTNGGQESQCGWCKDRFGLSWQIAPAKMGDWMSDPARADRVMKAFLPMRKIDLAALECAAAGN